MGHDKGGSFFHGSCIVNAISGLFKGQPFSHAELVSASKQVLASSDSGSDPETTLKKIQRKVLGDQKVQGCSKFKIVQVVFIWFVALQALNLEP